MRPQAALSRNGGDRLAAVNESKVNTYIKNNVPATFEVVYGHAWKGEPRTTPEGHAIVRVTRPRDR